MAEHKGDTSEKIKTDDIIREGSKTDVDQVIRQTRRGDETKGDPDERDVAGAVDFEDTPHGWEERKHQVEKEASENAG